MRHIKQYNTLAEAQEGLGVDYESKYIVQVGNQPNHEIYFDGEIPTPEPPTPTGYTWVSITDVDNTTPLYDIAWKTTFGNGDKWFAEKSGLVTDNMSWLGGTGTTEGRYTYHRFNSSQYTCNFDPKYNQQTPDGDYYGDTRGYGIAMRDVRRNTLPTETIGGNQYYVLGIENWESWKPLYVPYSNSFITSNFSEGDIMVKIIN